MLIDGVTVPESLWESGEWPWTVPAIRAVVEDGLRFTRPVTVLVGANGSGKSTLLEAIAEAYGMDVRGGHGGRQYGSSVTKSPLGSALQLSRTAAGRKFTGARNAKGFFLRAETAFGVLAFMTDAGISGYGERLSWEVSHGESYLQAIGGRFSGPGLYLLDEAEGPLSFHSTLALLYRLGELADSKDAQVIYATHSPLVAAMPGAQILELSDTGIADREWDELETVSLWRSFLNRPQMFFED